MDDSSPSFGNMLRDVRLKAGLYYSDIEQKVGVNPNSVSAWEHDECLPVKSNFDKLVEMLPDLKGIDFGIQDIQPPPGPRGVYIVPWNKGKGGSYHVSVEPWNKHSNAAHGVVAEETKMTAVSGFVAPSAPSAPSAPKPLPKSAQTVRCPRSDSTVREVGANYAIMLARLAQARIDENKAEAAFIEASNNVEVVEERLRKLWSEMMLETGHVGLANYFKTTSVGLPVNPMVAATCMEKPTPTPPSS